MKTKIGIQGDQQAMKSAIRNWHETFRKTKDLAEKREERENIICVFTWQDTIKNLRYVLKHVKADPRCPEIIAQKIQRADRKNRRDVFFVTEDNVRFKKLFNQKLLDLQKQKTQ